MKAAAHEGDLAGLIYLLQKFPPPKEDFPFTAAVVRYGVKQASRQSSRHFTRSVFRASTAILGNLLIRLHAYVAHRLREIDACGEQSIAPLPEELCQRILPQLEELTRMSSDVAQAWAATERLWKLSRRNAGQRRRDSAEESYASLVATGAVHFPCEASTTE
jgi:hypothetical protein